MENLHEKTDESPRIDKEANGANVDLPTADDDGTLYDSIQIPRTGAEETHEKQSAKEKTDENGEEELVFLSGLKLYLMIGALALSVLLVALDHAIISTAVPTITSEFDSLRDISWYGSAFLMCVCALQPISGKIFQYFSLKWTYLSFIAVFELGCLLCGAATSSRMLITGRAIAGCGATGLFSGALVIIANTISTRERPFYTSIVASMFGVANMFGPVLGGAFTEHASWRWCFYINLPFGAVIIGILVLILHPPPRKTSTLTFQEKLKHLDLISVSIFIPAILMLLLAVQWGGTTYAWSSATIIGLFCGAAVTFLIFAAMQWHNGDSASIPSRILLQRSVFSASMVTFLCMGALQTSMYYLPVWFQVIEGVSPTQSGVRYLGTIIPNIIFAIVSGALVSRLGYFTPWLFFGTTMCAVGLGLYTTLKVDSGISHWLGFQVITGAGAGCIIQMPLIAVMAVVKHDDIPIGTSIVLFFQFFGGAIFLTIAQSIFNSHLLQNLIAELPNVDPFLIINVGAAAVRKVVSGPDLDCALRAYNGAITTTLYVSAAGASVAFLFCFGVEWISVREKKKPEETE